MNDTSRVCFRLRSLAKTYRKGADGETNVALDCESLDVPWNARVAILGPSGSGKTTLLNVLGLLDDPDPGPHAELVYDERHLLAGNADRAEGAPEPAGPRERDRLRRREFGFIFQFHHLLHHLPCRENVAIPLGLAGASGHQRRLAAHWLLARLGMRGHARKSPRQLSGGEQQRIAVLRAIAHDPRVVFADEPTGNLDPENSRRVLGALVGWQARHRVDGRPRTLLLATHKPADAYQTCDHFLILLHGRPHEGRLLLRGKDVCSAEALSRMLVPREEEPEEDRTSDHGAEPPAASPNTLTLQDKPRRLYLAYHCWRELTGHAWSALIGALMLLMLTVLAVVGWGLLEGKRRSMSEVLETPLARRLDADCLLRGQSAIDPALVGDLEEAELDGGHRLRDAAAGVHPWCVLDLMFCQGDETGPTELVDHFVPGRTLQAGDPLLSQLAAVRGKEPMAFSSNNAWEIVVTEPFLRQCGYRPGARMVWLESKRVQMPLAIRGVVESLPDGGQFLLPDGLHQQMCSDAFDPDPEVPRIWLAPFPAQKLADARARVEELLANGGLALEATDGRLEVVAVSPPARYVSELWKRAAAIRAVLGAEGVLRESETGVGAPESDLVVKPQWTHVTIEVARLGDLGAVADAMEQHGLSVNRRYVEAIERLRRTIGPLERILVLVVVVIGLVVMTNLVLTTWQRLQQRKYEIGILKAGGMKTRYVIAVFVGEALVLGAATGLAGIGLGYLLGKAVSSQVASGWFVFTPWMGSVVFVAALGITVLACLLGTCWIARRRPVELLLR